MSNFSIIEDLFVLQRFDEANDLCKHFLKQFPKDHIQTCDHANCGCRYLLLFQLYCLSMTGKNAEMEQMLTSHFGSVNKIPFSLFTSLVSLQINAGEYQNAEKLLLNIINDTKEEQRNKEWCFQTLILNVLLPQQKYDDARKLLRKTTIITTKQKNSLLESIKPLEESNSAQKAVPISTQSKEKEQQSEHERQLVSTQTQMTTVSKIKRMFERFFHLPISFLSIALFAATVIMFLLRKRVGKTRC